MTDSPRLARFAAGTGIAGTLLFLLSFLWVSDPPKASDSRSDIAGWLAENGSSLRTAQYVGGLALILLVWFSGTLWAHLRAAEGPAGRLSQIYLIAVAATSAIFLVQSGLLTVATYEPTGEGEAVAATLYRLAAELGPHLAFLIGPLVAAAGLVALRYGALPRALGWFSLAFAAYTLIEGACVINESGELAPGGAFNAVGPVLFSVWVIWASAALVQRTGSSSPRSDTTGTASVL